MRLKIGNFKGPQGEQGKTGKKGDTGETGQRGSRWASGTAITGTSTIGTKFPGSGITDALVHDCYVNVNTGNIYECTVSGTADVAEWVHIGNIKGPTGATGPAGSISDINNQKPTYSEASKLENIASGEAVNVAFGKLKKAISVLITHYTQKATQSILGHVKLSNSAAITTSGEYALDAIEKNATIDGTLAHMLAQVNSNLSIETIGVTLSNRVSPTFGASGRSNISCVKYGRICILSIQIQIDNGLEPWEIAEIAYGMPVCYNHMVPVMLSITSEASETVPMHFSMDWDKQTLIAQAGAKALPRENYLYGSMAYICKN